MYITFILSVPLRGVAGWESRRVAGSGPWGTAGADESIAILWREFFFSLPFFLRYSSLHLLKQKAYGNETRKWSWLTHIN